MKNFLHFYFVSCIKTDSAEIAQLVEQRIRNAWVVCSNHILGTTCGCSSMVERKLPKLKTRVRFPSPAP